MSLPFCGSTINCTHSNVNTIRMERIRWFSCNEDNNSLSLHAIDALAIVPFLKNLDFSITEITAFNDQTTSNINYESEKDWVTESHSIAISSLMEKDDNQELHSIKIELERGGLIVFEHGQLFVQYPLGENLKDRMIAVFDTYGYYAGKEIWEFSCQHKEQLLLDYVLALRPQDITDEFDKMLEYSKRFANS